MILSNSNGRYPQGFQTPGIVPQWQQANGGAVNGVGSMADSRKDARQFSIWFQDDWRTTPRLTLNLGVRYDLDFNFWDQENLPNNATRLALEAIGHPDAAAARDADTRTSRRESDSPTTWRGMGGGCCAAATGSTSIRSTSSRSATSRRRTTAR